MKKILCYSAILLSLFYKNLLAQDPPPMPEMGGDFKLNYESYRLDKFIDQDQANYSGDLVFSIPLLSVPGRHGHNFDIKLSYNSNIHQKQFASWVGLGWSLELGSVERTVNGRTDEPTHLIGDLGARGNLGGRFKVNYWEDQIINRDMADQYMMSIDGGGMEIMPVASDVDSIFTISSIEDFYFTFLPIYYKPWNIRGYTYGSGLAAFDAIKEDGTRYIFGGLNDGEVEYKDVIDDIDPQEYQFPYRWNLSKIIYPDGSKTIVTYASQDMDTCRYSTIMIDRSKLLLDCINNYFGYISDYGALQNNYVKSTFAHPETLYTDTHYAVFLTSLNNIDSNTDRNCKLDTIVVYDRETNTELKRITFHYAESDNPNPVWTSGDSPDWNEDEKLKDNQLTLVGFTIENNNLNNPKQNFENNADHQQYTFTYTKNPKLDMEWLYTTHTPESYWPGYYPFYSFAGYSYSGLWAAWRLESITLPTGGKYTYEYDTFKVGYDPEGNPSPNGSDFWNYSSEAKCRLTTKTFDDGFSSKEWTYNYSDAVFDPPSILTLDTFIPVIHRANYIQIKHQYYKFFRGCTVGHRWVKVTNPDNSWQKTYFTSSYKSYDTLGIESQPDYILNYNPPYNIGLITSRAGRRGLIWKIETGNSVTYNYYSYEDVGLLMDRYDYYNLTNNNIISRQYMRRASAWAKLDSTLTYYDGVPKIVKYVYNFSPRHREDPDNGLVRREETDGSNNRRVINYEYACHKYPGMNWEESSSWMLNQPYSTTISDGKFGKDVSKEFTTWEKISNHWLPRSKYLWNGSPEDIQAPGDTNDVDVIRSEFLIYDNMGYSNIINVIDANDNMTQYFFSDNINLPYTNTEGGLNKGYVTGIQKAQPSPLLRTSLQYDHYGNVTAKTDENEDTTKAEYDNLGRIISVKNPLHQEVHHFGYYMPNTLSPPDAELNYLSDCTYRSQNDYTLNRRFYDGGGNERQRLSSNNNLDIITAFTYDNMSRLSRTYKPYEVDLGSGYHKYDDEYSAHTIGYYYSPNVYQLNDYYTDGTNRIKNSHGEVNLTNHYKHIEYGKNSNDEVIFYPPNILHKTSIYDENNNYSDPSGYKIKNLEYSDIFGNNITTVTDSGGLNLNTYYEYDIMNKLIGVTLPNQHSLQNYSTDDTSQIFSNPMTTGNLQIDISPGPGTKYVHLELLSYSDCTPNSPGPKSSIRNGIKELIGPKVYYRIKQYQDGNLIHQSPEYNLYCPGLGSARSIEYSVDALATQVELSVINIDYPCEDNSVRVSFFYSSSNKAFTSTYKYNKRGLMTEKTSIDAGTVKYLYDKVGNLRFSQDANQSPSDKFTYQKYDKLNRLIEVGEYSQSGNFTQETANIVDFPNDDDPYKILQKKFYYDTDNNAGLRNLKGNLSKSVAYKQGNISLTTLYSYEENNWVEFMLQQIPGMSDRKISYWYDWQGNVTKKCVSDSNENTLYTFYEYDAAGRLSKVFTNTLDSQTGWVQEAEHIYKADGKDTVIYLGNAQEMNYAYNERGWLTQINHQNLYGADKFGEIIGYNEQGHIATGTGFNFQPQYNGNISWLITRTKDVPLQGVDAGYPDPIIGYVYNYDNANRLTKADFGYFHITNGWSNSLPKAAMYDVPLINYDENGNITELKRNGVDALLIDDFDYIYEENTNRLSSIINFMTDPYYYNYDNNGNVKSDEMREINGFTYNISNLPEQMIVDGSTVNYWYDATGNRSRKQDAAMDIDEIYVLGINGETEAVFDADGTIKFFNITAGNEILGRYIPGAPTDLYLTNITLNQNYEAINSITVEDNVNVNGTASLTAGTVIYLKPGFTANSGCNFNASIEEINNVEERFYHLKDHLGSIRVTVDENGEIVNSDDYDPWGLQLNGRSTNIAYNDEKYKFTSKERDVETGYDYFGARYYDSRIGRWLQVDLLAEKYPGWSPYNYTMNNPLKFIDINGLDTWSYSITKGFGGRNGIGVGGSLSWVWDDQGNAGLLFTLGVGGLAQPGFSIGVGINKTDAENIYSLQGLGYSLGAMAGNGWGFNTEVTGDFNGTYQSDFSYGLGYVTGPTAYAMVTFSQLLFSGRAIDFKAIRDHIAKGGKIDIDTRTMVIKLIGKKGKAVKTIQLDNIDNGIDKNKPNKNSEGFYEEPSDNTKVKTDKDNLKLLDYDPSIN